MQNAATFLCKTRYKSTFISNKFVLTFSTKILKQMHLVQTFSEKMHYNMQSFLLLKQKNYISNSNSKSKRVNERQITQVRTARDQLPTLLETHLCF